MPGGGYGDTVKISGLIPVPPPSRSAAAVPPGAAGGTAKTGVPGAAPPSAVPGAPGAAGEGFRAVTPPGGFSGGLSGGLTDGLLSFFRFFSLPLDSGALGTARLAAMAMPRREAAALALAAAADKGLVLEGRALAEYADAVDPSGPPSGDGEGGASSGGGGPPSGGGGADTAADGGNGAWGRGGGASSGEGGGNGARREERPAPGERTPPEELRRRVTETLGNRPVLDFINRIPGKSGRWMVIPFTVTEGGVTLKVSLRVAPGAAARLAADVSVFRGDAAGGEPERRWFFAFTGAGGADGEAAGFSPRGLEFSVTPSLGINRRKLERAAAEWFGLPRGTAALRDDLPPFADARAAAPPPVDESV